MTSSRPNAGGVRREQATRPSYRGHCRQKIDQRAPNARSGCKVRPSAAASDASTRNDTEAGLQGDKNNKGVGGDGVSTASVGGLNSSSVVLPCNLNLPAPRSTRCRPRTPSKSLPGTPTSGVPYPSCRARRSRLRASSHSCTRRCSARRRRPPRAHHRSSRSGPTFSSAKPHGRSSRGRLRQAAGLSVGPYVERTGPQPQAALAVDRRRPGRPLGKRVGPSRMSDPRRCQPM
jgi:hypothetical protein